MKPKMSSSVLSQLAILVALTLTLAPSPAWARWYDSGGGRFLSQDPADPREQLDNPARLAIWAYANGNPSRFTDPYGERAALPFEMEEQARIEHVIEQLETDFANSSMLYQATTFSSLEYQLSLARGYLKSYRQAIADAADGEPVVALADGPQGLYVAHRPGTDDLGTTCHNFGTGPGAVTVVFQSFFSPQHNYEQFSAANGLASRLGSLGNSPLSTAGYLLVTAAGGSDEARNGAIDVGGLAWTFATHETVSGTGKLIKTGLGGLAAERPVLAGAGPLMHGPPEPSRLFPLVRTKIEPPVVPEVAEMSGGTWVLRSANGTSRTADGQYIFVTTPEGQILITDKDGKHTSLTQGKKVAYAGEVTFENGKVATWDNGSGHYEPSLDYAWQAGFPMFSDGEQVFNGLLQGQQGEPAGTPPAPMSPHAKP